MLHLQHAKACLFSLALTVLGMFVMMLAVACGRGGSQSASNSPSGQGSTPTTSSGGLPGSSGSGGTGSSGSGGTASSGSGTGSGSGGSGGTGSGGSGAGSGGSGGASASMLAPCGTQNNSGNSLSGNRITGRIVDAASGQAIQGTVFVTVDRVSGSQAGTWFDVTQTNSNGNFTTDPIVTESSAALMFAAVSSSGAEYVPTLLVPGSSCPIGGQTEIGTVGLAAGAAGNTTALIAAQTASGSPALVNEIPDVLNINYQATNFALSLHFVANQQMLAASSSCPQNTACATAKMSVSASPAEAAIYAGQSTQFQPVGSQASYVFAVRWGQTFNPQTYNCTPQEALSKPTNVSPDQTADFGTLAFTGC